MCVYSLQEPPIILPSLPLTYHRVEEGMFQSLFCCDSFLHVHHQTLSDQILGILCKSLEDINSLLPGHSSPLLTRYLCPLGRRETILSLHDIPQHHHLLAMPERRTADQQREHNNSTGPPGDSQGQNQESTRSPNNL